MRALAFVIVCVAGAESNPPDAPVTPAPSPTWTPMPTAAAPPRMRFHGKDTPICVTKSVGGQIRGACCPPGIADPTNPECVAEGTIDEMFHWQRAWEWCNKDHPPSKPCEPCVWVTNAQRN